MQQPAISDLSALRKESSSKNARGKKACAKPSVSAGPDTAPPERKTTGLISDMIRKMRESASISQATLARELQVTRSSVNAWESGLSTPTTQYIVAMAKYFHVTSDYLLEVNDAEILSLEKLTPEEIQIVRNLADYFRKGR